MKYLILIFSLLYLYTFSNAKRIHNLTGYSDFVKTEVIFDHQPIRGKTLIYAACDKNSTCSITLTTFPEKQLIRKNTKSQTEENKTQLKNEEKKELWKAHSCQVEYQPKDKTFQLRHLYDEQVIVTQHDSLRIIDMKNCTIKEYKINLSKKVHIVPYTESFDIYYQDRNHCGSFMCGIAFDKTGDIINGPTISFLPLRLMKDDISVCPVKSGSSGLGHFLLSSSGFWMVSSSYGKVTNLMEYPKNAETHTFSCHNNLLGFCWVSKYSKKQIKCVQYDTKGELVSSTSLSLGYQSGNWLSMVNLGEGDMLLLTNECMDKNWCSQNTDSVEFHLIRAYGTDDYESLHKFQGFVCDNLKDLKTEVYRNNNGDNCVTLACRAEFDNDRSRVKFQSTCISHW